jgi:predicted dehydrogenase
MTAIPLRVGVCGLGSIGLRHARLLGETAGVTVTGYDASPQGLKLPPGVAANITVAESFEELLDAAPDGLVVATPDALHAPQAIEACLRGSAVLVEKPVAESVAAAEELARVAARSGAGVLVGYVLRHYAVLRRVREMLAEGDAGAVVSVHVNLGAYETLRLARNRFSDQDRYRLPYDYSHEWDYLQWLLGPVDSVAAVGRLAGDLPLTQNPNVLNGLLTFGEGITGTFHLDYVQEGQGRRLDVVGDRGTLRADLAAGIITVRGHGDSLTRQYDCAEERDVAFGRQLAHFLDVVRGEATPVVGVEDGIRALRVADAVVAACESGSWQQVPEGN